MRSSSLALAMMLLATAAQPGPIAIGSPDRKPDPIPRRFTEARKAEAMAKQQRKNAKRAAAIRRQQNGGAR